jgi:hypothetical protein
VNDVTVSHAEFDGDTTNLPPEARNRKEVRFAWELDASRWDGHREPLPQNYDYEGATWVSTVEFLPDPERGSREKGGHAATANPWTED